MSEMGVTSVDGYNLSCVVPLLHTYPHLQLTRSGLIELHNTTFDYGRRAYLNSLLVTFLEPLVVLLLLLLGYLLFVLLSRYNRTVRDKLYSGSFQIRQGLSGAATVVGTQNKGQPYRSVRWDGTQTCYIGLVLFGIVSLVVFFYGSVILAYGLQQCDSYLSEFIDRAGQSKASVRSLNHSLNQWSDQIARKNSSIPGLNHIYRNTARIANSNVNYIFSKLLDKSGASGSSASNLLWFQWQFRTSFASIIFLCSLVCLVLGFFWFWMVLKLVQLPPGSKLRADRFHFILFTIATLHFSVVIFSLALTSSVTGSDFCLSAKPVIADIVLYKNPNNQFHPTFVHYYLYCGSSPDDKRWWTNLNVPLIEYLNKLDQVSVFDYKLRHLVDVDRLRSRLTDTYQVVACSELNRLLNQGLALFCTKSIDGLSIVSGAMLASSFSLLITLFVFTHCSSQ